MKLNRFREVTAFVVTLTLASSLFADTLFDSEGFESPAYSLGSLTGQNGWGKDGIGTATVHTADPNEFVRVTAGIMRASSGTPTKNYGFFLDAYNLDLDRIGRAGLGVSGGNPALYVTYKDDSFGVADYVLETGLSWDTWYTLQIDFWFNKQTFDVYLDDILISDNLAFVTSANDLSDIDLTKQYTGGATDIGYFDNYKVEALPVPEPSAISLALLGLAGVALRLRRGR
ncbi:MAG: hypothetical protein BWX84_00961 [Verrucomicrobia bacterium ADurb.Bin118]|nr:MAG: hypothetical protein BWX84_00961 [Verrucomicrobia bacterium ADurb.Bin118]